MTIPLKKLTYGPCPYLNYGPSWKVAEFSCRDLPPETYEALLAKGFRRSGTSFYRTICEGCNRCYPIRVDADHFTPTRSQRRVARRNRDIQVSFDPRGVGFREDRFRLYEEYCSDRHGRPSGTEEGPLAYMAFLVDSPLGNVAVTEYRAQKSGGSLLVGNGYLDVLPNGLSSIYFVWEQEFHQLSLGTFSILREIELCRTLKKRWYYLGFWVPGSPVMDYKANFYPAQIALDGEWVPLAEGMRETLRGAA